MAGPIASMVVRLGVNSGPFSAGLAKAAKSAVDFGGAVAKAVKFGAVGAVGSIAPVVTPHWQIATKPVGFLFAIAQPSLRCACVASASQSGLSHGPGE